MNYFFLDTSALSKRYVAELGIFVKNMLRLEIGDRLILRKEHACGGKEWEVWRLGMDIGIKCLRCGRKLKIVRSELEKIVKKKKIHID